MEFYNRLFSSELYYKQWVPVNFSIKMRVFQLSAEVTEVEHASACFVNLIAN